MKPKVINILVFFCAALLAGCAASPPARGLDLKTGRTLHVVAHITMPLDYAINGLSELDEFRESVQRKVDDAHGPATVDLVFTANREWAAFSGS